MRLLLTGGINLILASRPSPKQLNDGGDDDNEDDDNDENHDDADDGDDDGDNDHIIWR